MRKPTEKRTSALEVTAECLPTMQEPTECAAGSYKMQKSTEYGASTYKVAADCRYALSVASECGPHSPPSRQSLLPLP